MQIEFINIEQGEGFFTPKLCSAKDFKAYATLIPEPKLGKGVDYSKGELLSDYVFSSILDVVNFSKRKFPDSALFFTIDGSRNDFSKYLFGGEEGRKAYNVLMEGGDI